MRRLSGFSLMEMMVVLLITAIIAAAAAPMINRKLLETQAENGTPWLYATNGTSTDIAYNFKGNDSVASIGALIFPITDDEHRPSMFIKSAENKPHLSLLTDSSTLDANEMISIDTNKSSLLMTSHNNYANNNELLSSVIIGHNAGNNDGSSSPTGVTAVGNGAKITGDESTAIGSQAQAAKTSVAIGSHSEAVIGSVAIGGYASGPPPTQTKAKGNYSVAIGSSAQTQSDSSVAIGRSVSVSEDAGSSVAIGYNVKAQASKAVAIGRSNTVLKDAEESVAIGFSANAQAANAIAIGSSSYAKEHSIAIGSGTVQANYENSIALGCQARTFDKNSIALGYKAQVTGIGSIGLGDSARTVSEKAIAIGASAKSWSDNSIAIGTGAQSKNRNSIAIGHVAIAQHDESVAIGPGAVTTAANEIMLGTSSKTVHIPGKLVVDGDIEFKNLVVKGDADVVGNLKVGGNSYLGCTQGSNTYIRLHEYNGNNREHSMWRVWVKGGAEEELRISSKSNRITPPTVSDRRLKNVGKPFTGGLEEIKKLEVFNYTFKKDPDKTPHVGVMAQDLEKIFPKAVFKGDDGFLRIRMEDMFYALVNAVKELSDKIDSLLNNEISTLQKQVNELEKQNQEIKKLNERA